MPNNLSSQELAKRATANGYRHGAHRAEDSISDKRHHGPKTLKDHQTTLRVYEKWIEEYPPEQDIRLREGLPTLDLATTKDFLRFHASSAQGRLDTERGRITVDSLIAFAEWFHAAFARATGNGFSKEFTSEIFQWIKWELAREGLIVNLKKPKHLFGETELVHFNTTFWTVDETCFVHPRNKAQIPFLIAVFCWTGARIGALLPSPENNKKDGLRYKDVEMVLLRTSSGSKLIYRVDQRWVKNNHDKEVIVFGASTSQHGKLLYDDTQYLLALAIADHAIYGIDSVEDLWELQIPANENELLLRWHKEVRELPIIRNATQYRGVVEEPLPRETFQNILKQILKLSGYFGTPTIHAIRRGLGKPVDKRYTAAQRSQHLTQKDKSVYGQSYVANTSSVDGRSAFLNEPPQHDHVEFFQSFAKFREQGLPTKLPAEEEAAVKQDPQLLVLQSDVKRLLDNSSSVKEVKAARTRVNTSYRKLAKARLGSYQLDWVQKRRDWKVITRGKERPDDLVKTDLSEIFAIVMPEHGRLAKTMISTVVVSDKDRMQAVKDLHTLVSRDCTTLYRPGEEPFEGNCPVKSCMKPMKDLIGPRRGTHIHKCRHEELASNLGRPQRELVYCFTCFHWFVEEDWDKHCQMHLESITSKNCATITYCQTLFRPSFCPFCLGDDRSIMSAPMRWKSWVREAQLRDHLQRHLTETSWPLRCPHPLCALDLANETSFLCHLQNVHSLKMTAKQKDLVAKSLGSEGPQEKRKMQEVAEYPSESSKRGKLTPEITHPWDHTATTLPEIALTSDVDEAYDLPDLADDKAPLLSDSDGLSLINDIEALFSSDLDPHPAFSSPPVDFSQRIDTTTIDPPEAPSDIVLFTDPQPDLDTFNSDAVLGYGADHPVVSAWDGDPLTVSPRDTILPAESIPIANQDHVRQNRKPRVTLHVHQHQDKPKPKLRLRLSQPKKRPAPKTLRRQSQPKRRPSRKNAR